MAVRKRLIVVGDGASGISLANRVRMLTNNNDVEIVLIGSNPTHFLKEDGPQIAVGLKNYKNSVKNTDFLVNFGIAYIQDEVVRVDPANKTVSAKSGKSYDYDFLVLALGGNIFAEGIPGYVGEARHFHDLQHAQELKEYVEQFKGGNIVIGNSPGSRMNPYLTYEFAFLISELINNKKLASATKLHLISGKDSDSATDAIEAKLKALGFEVHKDFDISGISSKNREIQSSDGKAIKYDLLVLSPPSSPEEVLVTSGLVGENGFVSVDKFKLNLKNYKEVYAIGECNDAPVPKCLGSSLHQAEYLAKMLAHKMSGAYYDSNYDGSSISSILIGDSRSVTVYSNYNKLPAPTEGSFTDHMLNITSTETYFSAAVRGVF
ncbi:MAG: hypothetical protein B2I17_06700 [Thermoplasmatales archaeon B_DKE]|nr:MAG: hypothetical protein B2I17_06700 [Thermoplasmatales archaeon B_DKE]